MINRYFLGQYFSHKNLLARTAFDAFRNCIRSLLDEHVPEK